MRTLVKCKNEIFDKEAEGKKDGIYFYSERRKNGLLRRYLSISIPSLGYVIAHHFINRAYVTLRFQKKGYILCQNLINNARAKLLFSELILKNGKSDPDLLRIL